MQSKGNRRLFLGLDSSTQGLKAIAIDAELRVAGEAGVNFDTDLPEFRTKGGVHVHPDGVTVTSPPLMWVAALDILLERMKKNGFAFDDVAAVSGSGQQHGSVWLGKGARSALAGLNPGKSLRDQLAGIFSVDESPIWMDSSTGRQCRALEQALGGPQAVADLTGSRAYERFTGNQIAKICQTRRKDYDATERIALVSSFVASLLIGGYAPIDAGDGSGMNLMDLRSKKWAPSATKATAPDLETKLGAIELSHTSAGRIHSYFVGRYGFNPACEVITFSGDNPCSLAGLRLQRPGDVAISLGTSDTMFGSVSDPVPSGEGGHVFANPVDPDAFMVMIVRKNGSLTREKVRDACAGASWDAFNAALRRTPPGNNGNISLHVDQPEITPPLHKTGVFRRDARGKTSPSFPPEVEVRAVVEGAFLSLRIHGDKIGFRPKSILATGGASANPEIIRIICDVFGVPVYVGDQPNSAALGAAYRAMHGKACSDASRFVSFSKAISGAPGFKKAADPEQSAHKSYAAMLSRYEKLEEDAAAGQ